MAYFDAPYRPADLTLNSDAINNSCVGFWPLTDGSGTSAVDVSTGGNNATQSGGVSWASTDIGTAASFDGVDDYFNLGTSFWNDNIAGGHDFSINAWFYVDSTSSDSCITGSWGSEKNLIMWVDVGGSSVSLTCIGTDSGFPITSTSAPTVSTGSWHMGTLVADNTAGTATVYLNGVSSNSVSYTASLGTITNPFGLGSDRGVATFRQMSGDIQNVRIFNAALTAAQVEQLYTRPWTGTNYDTEALWLSPPASPTLSTASEATSLMANCVAWWPLVKGSGTVATDLVGSNDGTLQGNAAFVSSKIGNALSCSGVSQSGVAVPTNPTASVPITLSAWFKTSNTSSDIYLIDGDDSSDRFVIHRNTSGTLIAWAGGSCSFGTSNSVIADGNWHHVVAVYTSSGITVYFDGEQDGTGPAATHSISGFRIGARYGFSHNWDGELQNIRVWDRALSSSEVALLAERPWVGAEYNETAPLYPPVPSSLTPLESSNSILVDQELWLPLTDGSGATAVDISGGGNDGTITNATWRNSEVGTALEIDATGEYVQSSIASTVFDSRFTVATWLEIDKFNGSNTTPIFSVESDYQGGNYTNGSYIAMGLKNSGTQLHLHNGNGIGPTQVIDVIDGRWHLFILDYNPTNGSYNFYLDGVLSATGTRTKFRSPTGSIRFFGGGFYSAGSYVTGGQNVRVWSRALSASEVADIFYSPWLGSAYPSTGGGTPSYFVAAQFNRLGIGPRFRRL